ncbi:MAG TPA: hypothetical protein VEL68_00310 [Thermodesulfobacteriota bacterium]|nr:hypothetical protein [Thermodesulfobacteriota bacterium]
MKCLSAVLLGAFFAAWIPILQSCSLITLPLTSTVFGGAQLALKGAELQKEISKADVRKSFESPFEKTWNMAAITLVNLHIEIAQIGKTPDGNGGLIEGRARKIKVKVIAIEITENITEVGIWTDYDKALAELIAEKIKEEVQKQDHPIQGIGSEVE